MKGQFKLPLLKLPLLFFLITLISCQDNLEMEKVIDTITVKVIDADDNFPIEGLFVILEGKDDIIYTSYSDNRGITTFSQVNANLYKMRLLIYGESTKRKVYYWDCVEHGYDGGVDFYQNPNFTVYLKSEN